jgi:hypothetical protein
MDGLKDAWMGWMDGWKDGRIEGGMDGAFEVSNEERMEGWKD